MPDKVGARLGDGGGDADGLSWLSMMAQNRFTHRLAISKNANHNPFMPDLC
jgi:hypothetical protein